MILEITFKIHDISSCVYVSIVCVRCFLLRQFWHFVLPHLHQSLRSNRGVRVHSSTCFHRLIHMAGSLFLDHDALGCRYQHGKRRLPRLRLRHSGWFADEIHKRCHYRHESERHSFGAFDDCVNRHRARSPESRYLLLLQRRCFSPDLCYHLLLHAPKCK